MILRTAPTFDKFHNTIINEITVIKFMFKDHKKQKKNDKYTCLFQVFSSKKLNLTTSFISYHSDNLWKSHINSTTNTWRIISITQDFEPFESLSRDYSIVKMKFLVVLVIVACAVGLSEVTNVMAAHIVDFLTQISCK